MVYRLRDARIAHVHHRKTLRHHMADDIRKATVHHELDAVRASSLIAMPNQPHIAAVVRKRGNSITLSSFCRMVAAPYRPARPQTR